MTACARCVTLAPLAESAHRCAFQEGKDFRAPATGCGTMTSLCALSKAIMQRTDTGLRTSILVGPDAFLAMLWRQPEIILGALVFDEKGTRALTLPEADRFIEHNVPRRG